MVYGGLVNRCRAGPGIADRRHSARVEAHVVDHEMGRAAEGDSVHGVCAGEAIGHVRFGDGRSLSVAFIDGT